MKKVRWVNVFMLIVLLAPPAQAQLAAARTLHGLAEVSVVVADVHPDAERRGLSRTMLQKAMETRLQQAGLRISNNVTEEKTSEHPLLYLQVGIAPLENLPVYIATVELQLRQNVCLARNLIICETVITWQDTSAIRAVGVSRLASLQQDVHTIVDHFTAAYLAENHTQ